MKFPIKLLALTAILALASISCRTKSVQPGYEGVCVQKAKRYEARHAAYGQAVWIVYYFVQNEDGGVPVDDNGNWIAHALNYTEDDTGARTYVDPSYDPPRSVDEPTPWLIFYDSQEEGTPLEQEQAFITALRADPWKLVKDKGE